AWAFLGRQLRLVQPGWSLDSECRPDHGRAVGDGYRPASLLPEGTYGGPDERLLRSRGAVRPHVERRRQRPPVPVRRLPRDRRSRRARRDAVDANRPCAIGLRTRALRAELRHGLDAPLELGRLV